MSLKVQLNSVYIFLCYGCNNRDETKDLTNAGCNDRWGQWEKDIARSDLYDTMLYVCITSLLVYTWLARARDYGDNSITVTVQGLWTVDKAPGSARGL